MARGTDEVIVCAECGRKAPAKWCGPYRGKCPACTCGCEACEQDIAEFNRADKVQKKKL